MEGFMKYSNFFAAALIVSITICALLAGCSSDSSKIIGTWIEDGDKNIVIQYKNDGTFISTGSDTDHSGTYKIGSSKGVMTLTEKCETCEKLNDEAQKDNPDYKGTQPSMYYVTIKDGKLTAYLELKDGKPTMEGWSATLQ